MTDTPHLHKLIPHRFPMVLLDELIAVDDENVQCQVTIREDSVFFDAENQAVPAWVGIEMMAQSVAAWAGHKSWKKNDPAPIGFLLGTRRYEANADMFNLGDVLQVFATRDMESSGMAVFSCRIEMAGKNLAGCLLNLYRPDAEQLETLLKRKVI